MCLKASGIVLGFNARFHTLHYICMGHVYNASKWPSAVILVAYSFTRLVREWAENAVVESLDPQEAQAIALSTAVANRTTALKEKLQLKQQLRTAARQQEEVLAEAASRQRALEERLVTATAALVEARGAYEGRLAKTEAALAEAQQRLEAALAERQAQLMVEVEAQESVEEQRRQLQVCAAGPLLAGCRDYDEEYEELPVSRAASN